MCWLTDREVEAIEDATMREPIDAEWKPISYVQNITMYKCDRCQKYETCTKDKRRDLGRDHIVPDLVITAKNHGVCPICEQAIVRKQSKIIFSDTLDKWIHATCRQFIED